MAGLHAFPTHSKHDGKSNRNPSADLSDANDEVAALLASMDRQGSSAFVRHLPADTSEEDQVAELFERAMHGDFDEPPSSTELQDYIPFGNKQLRESGRVSSTDALARKTGSSRVPEQSDSASAAADSLLAVFGSTGSLAGQALPTPAGRSLHSGLAGLSSQGTGRPAAAASFSRPFSSPEVSSSQRLPNAACLASSLSQLAEGREPRMAEV
jgi:hypothetical protein